MARTNLMACLSSTFLMLSYNNKKNTAYLIRKCKNNAQNKKKKKKNMRQKAFKGKIHISKQTAW